MYMFSCRQYVNPLYCLIGECTHGEARLVNGSVSSEGRVEVCIDGTWGTVNNRQWSSNEARVLCGQLGYSRRCKYMYL